MRRRMNSNWQRFGVVRLAFLPWLSLASKCASMQAGQQLFTSFRSPQLGTGSSNPLSDLSPAHKKVKRQPSGGLVFLSVRDVSAIFAANDLADCELDPFPVTCEQQPAPVLRVLRPSFAA